MSWVALIPFYSTVSLFLFCSIVSSHIILSYHVSFNHFKIHIIRVSNININISKSMSEVIWLCHWLTFCNPLSVSSYLYPPLSISIYLSLYLPLSIFLSLSVSPYLYLPISIPNPLSLPLSPSLSLSLYLSTPLYPPSLSLSLYSPLSPSFSHSPSIYLYLFLSLSLLFSFSPSLSISRRLWDIEGLMPNRYPRPSCIFQEESCILLSQRKVIS